MSEPLPHRKDDATQPAERPYFRQLALQLAAAFAVLSIAWPYFALRNQPLPWPQTAWAIGATALAIAWVTRQNWWWRLIHAIFAPLAAAVLGLGIDPGWFLLAFMLMLLVYRGALTGQIPLYLSNRATAAALAGLIPAGDGAVELRFVDLGAGIGSMVRALGLLRPDVRVTGVENAPATWAIGYLRTMALRNGEWRWGDLWRTDLGDYDVVYAFLSPAPMARLWAKVEREMKPGSLFVSNSFAVPEREAEQVVELDDARRTQLHCYRV